MHLKRQNSWPPDVSAQDALNDYTLQRHLVEKVVISALYKKTNDKFYEILTLYECAEK